MCFYFVFLFFFFIIFNLFIIISCGIESISSLALVPSSWTVCYSSPSPLSCCGVDRRTCWNRRGYPRCHSSRPPIGPDHRHYYRLHRQLPRCRHSGLLPCRSSRPDDGRRSSVCVVSPHARLVSTRTRLVLDRLGCLSRATRIYNTILRNKILI